MNRMYGRWRRWNRRRSFTKHFKNEVNHRLAVGDINDDEAVKAYDAANDPETMRKVMKELEANPDALGGRINWQRIKEWIAENWFDILKLVLSVAILLLDTDERTD